MAIITPPTSSRAPSAAKPGSSSIRWYIRRCAAGWATNCTRSRCRPARPRSETPIVEDRKNGRLGSTAHFPKHHRPSGRALHEGNAGVSAMRFLGRSRADPEPPRGQVQRHRCPRRSRDPAGHKGILQLADNSAALCEGRVRRRLRYHPRDVRDRRTAAVLRAERRRRPRLSSPPPGRSVRPEGSAGGDVGAEGQRVADIADRLEGTADATYRDCPITEDAAEQRLVDGYALDPRAVHFEGVTREETGFVNDALIGHRQLGRRPPDKSAHRRRQPQQPKNDRRDRERQADIPIIGGIPRRDCQNYANY